MRWDARRKSPARFAKLEPLVAGLLARLTYLLAVKDNQPTLFEVIQECFFQGMEVDFAGMRYEILEEEVEAGHGRTERRTYNVIYDPQGLRTAHEWADLKAIGFLERSLKGIPADSSIKRKLFDL